MTRTRTIPLGYEVGSGQVVGIPLHHLCICGQTQLSGKTTALEALITRSQLRALTFITKRGEGSFLTARRTEPYFREQADWQFVASILEASRGEKLKFERAWIIRASKGARTLTDVQRNVQKAMETAKGLSADVYLTLDAYLEAVVPTIARVRWAPGLQLAAGVNAMDLTSVPAEMQHLVIRSALEWVLERETDTVVVIPEAWKFLPQGRGTPVKLGAEAFIRQAAALRNFLWLDSQDLGGIEKTILRSVPMWILGVQRETNEIKRTLENIPAGTSKPTPAAIATLELGQFFACWGKHAIRTYVQPAWLTEGQAHSVAVGSIPVPPAPVRLERTMTNEEAARLTRENEQLRSENAELRRRLEALEGKAHEVQTRDRAADRARDPQRSAGARDRDGAPETHAGPAGDRGGSAGPRPPRTFTAEESFDNEALYQAIKARLIEELPSDPRVLQIVTSRPELRVEVERKVITADGDSLRGRIGRLIVDGFFDQAQTNSSLMAELGKRGFNTAPPNISRELGELTAMGFFTRDNKWYRVVPDMKVNIVELAGAAR